MSATGKRSIWYPGRFRLWRLIVISAGLVLVVGLPRVIARTVTYAGLVQEARSLSAAPLPAPYHKGQNKASPKRPWQRLASLSGKVSGTLSCVLGPRSAPAVTLLTKAPAQTWHCVALRLEGAGRAGYAPTLFLMRGGDFRAIPAGASAGAKALAFLGSRREGEVFRHIWIGYRDQRLCVWALLSGRAANGAYRFEIESRQSVRMTVKATLFFRRRPRVFGIPALASLYDYGVGNHMPARALYLARHTSDGLLIQTAHAAYWAPLRNPQSPYEHMFASPAVRKFGLWQRDRKARYYGTQKGHYQDAPNVWVQMPRHLQGHVILKEWPARAGDHDNVVAGFVPLVKPQAQTAFTASYRIDWTHRDRGRAMFAHVVSTLIGGNAVTGARKYVIDYAGGPLRAAGAQALVRGKVWVHPDTFVTQDTVGFNPYTGGWRQVIQVLPLAGRHLHVKAWLTFDHHLASEIWEYDVFPPYRSH